MKVLGILIGSRDFSTGSCIDSAQTGSQLCKELAVLGLLLRYSHASWISKTVCPRDSQPTSAIHDLLARSTFISLLDLDAGF